MKFKVGDVVAVKSYINTSGSKGDVFAQKYLKQVGRIGEINSCDYPIMISFLNINTMPFLYEEVRRATKEEVEKYEQQKIESKI